TLGLLITQTVLIDENNTGLSPVGFLRRRVSLFGVKLARVELYSILITIQVLLILPLLLAYIVKVVRFHSRIPPPDVYLEEELLTSYMRHQPNAEVGVSTTGGGENGPSMTELISVEFEVYGRVQGVFFRKHTQSKGKQLGLTGWCRNTRTGTVEGVMEGPRGKVDQMKRWLREEGSPSSRIDDAVFRNEEAIPSAKYPNPEKRRITTKIDILFPPHTAGEKKVVDTVVCRCLGDRPVGTSALLFLVTIGSGKKKPHIPPYPDTYPRGSSLLAAIDATGNAIKWRRRRRHV
ncbi:unnamed protein product, partial [Notodromas monacha]